MSSSQTSSQSSIIAAAPKAATKTASPPKILVTDIVIKAPTPCALRRAAERAGTCYGKYYPYALGRPTQTPCGGVQFRRSARIAKNVGEAKSFQLYSLP